MARASFFGPSGKQGPDRYAGAAPWRAQGWRRCVTNHSFRRGCWWAGRQGSMRENERACAASGLPHGGPAAGRRRRRPPGRWQICAAAASSAGRPTLHAGRPAPALRPLRPAPASTGQSAGLPQRLRPRWLQLPALEIRGRRGSPPGGPGRPSARAGLAISPAAGRRAGLRTATAPPMAWAPPLFVHQACSPEQQQAAALGIIGQSGRARTAQSARCGHCCKSAALQFLVAPRQITPWQPAGRGSSASGCRAAARPSPAGSHWLRGSGSESRIAGDSPGAPADLGVLPGLGPRAELRAGLLQAPANRYPWLWPSLPGLGGGSSSGSSRHEDRVALSPDRTRPPGLDLGLSSSWREQAQVP